MSKTPIIGDLSEENFQAFAQQVIDKYNLKGMIVDALVWSRIIALYDEALEKAKDKQK